MDDMTLQTPTEKPEIKTLGVIAGGGTVPAYLLTACERAGITPFVVAFEGQTDPRILKDRAHLFTRLGAAGCIINTLKKNDITDLVLIGSIRRPSLAELKPDMRTAAFFAKIGLKAHGDDGLLKALRGALEADGFTLHAVQDFAGDLLAKEGPVGTRKPGKGDGVDIARGLAVATGLGGLDVGQAVVVQEGIVLGVEAVEGTDELLRRCADLKRKGRGGVLVKIAKPGQDHALDLPTVGPETVRLAAKAGLAGIAVQAGATLLLDPAEIANVAGKHDMFVVGVRV